MGAWLAAGRRAVAMASVSVLVAVGLVAAVSDAAAAGAGESSAADPELLDRLSELKSWQPGDDPLSPPVEPARSAARLTDVPWRGPAAEVRLPRPARAAVVLGPERRRVGDSVVAVAAGSPAGEGRRLVVEVLDRSAAERAGAAGFVFAVSLGSPAGAVPVEFAVDYSGFADLFGAGFGGRLQLRALPGCVLSRQPVPGCAGGGVLVPARNDTAADMLVARVDDLGAVADGGTALLAVTAGPGGELEGSGDFKATPFELSSDWQVGVGSGEFSWSYPVPVPKPPAGGGPSLTLGYSSGSVDGLTSNRNTQAGPLGLGWGDLANAFVERRYTPCNEDKVEGQASLGDLCWKNDNATLSLNGRSAEMVRVPNSNPKQWRLKRDPRWRVEQHTGTFANGDSDKEYWKVITPDGVQYFFGLGVKLDGRIGTSSVYTVPVYANELGEPCWGTAPGNIGDSFCQQAWRWNLDRVVDPNQNATIYSYSPVTNYYKALLGMAGWRPYTKSGRLR